MPQLQILPQQPSFQQQLGQQIGAGLGQGISGGLQKSLEQFHQQKKVEQEGQKLEKLGLPKELAGQDPRIIQQYLRGKQKEDLIQKYLKDPSQQNLVHPGETPGISSDGAERGPLTQKDVEIATLIDPNLGRAKQSEMKIQAQEKQNIANRNLKVFDKTTEDLKSLEDSDQGLGQLEKLSEKIGKNQGQSFFDRLARSYRFDPETGGFTKFGKITSTPEEERYIKLIADQTKTIKNDFGARITNLDLEVFLRRFPDLMMTPKGREEIFGTLRDYTEAKKIYNKSLRNEIKISKGKTDPYALDEIVEQKIGPKLEKIRDRIAERGFSFSDKRENILTPEIAQDLLREAQGDKEEARKIAKERGYEF